MFMTGIIAMNDSRQQFLLHPSCCGMRSVSASSRCPAQPAASARKCATAYRLRQCAPSHWKRALRGGIREHQKLYGRHETSKQVAFSFPLSQLLRNNILAFLWDFFVELLNMSCDMVHAILILALILSRTSSG